MTHGKIRNHLHTNVLCLYPYIGYKINDTLDKVRGENPLQNPILRLGKMGNTYNKILAKSSIDNIRTFHRAQKNGINEISKDIKDISDVINDRVKIETDHYQYIDKNKFEEFF